MAEHLSDQESGVLFKGNGNIPITQCVQEATISVLDDRISQFFDSITWNKVNDKEEYRNHYIEVNEKLPFELRINELGQYFISQFISDSNILSFECDECLFIEETGEFFIVRSNQILRVNLKGDKVILMGKDNAFARVD